MNLGTKFTEVEQPQAGTLLAVAAGNLAALTWNLAALIMHSLLRQASEIAAVFCFAKVWANHTRRERGDSAGGWDLI